MILSLLSQTLAFRMAAAVSVASLVLLAAPSRSVQLTGLVIACMCSVFLDARPTVFEAALPLDARRVFLARTLAALALVCVPVVVWIVAGQLRGDFEPAADQCSALDCTRGCWS